MLPQAPLAQPPKGVQPKGVQSKGVQPKKSSVVRHADAAVLAEIKPRIPTGSLEPAYQAFSPPPIAKGTPIVKGMPIAKGTPIDKETSKKKAPTLIEKDPVKPTANYKPRHREVPPELDMITLAPALNKYMVDQTSIESANPYLTDTVIYTPQTRKSFYTFINDNYSDSFKQTTKIKGDLDKEACAKLDAGSDGKVEAFLYQKFIREYIRNAAPYRGILVYHGLGSGKTCMVHLIKKLLL